MNKNKTVKVVDIFNGWSSEPMTSEEADRYIELNPASGREIYPTEVEWKFDNRFGEWAWWEGERRIS
jgi:hypothetical protein